MAGIVTFAHVGFIDCKATVSSRAGMQEPQERDARAVKNVHLALTALVAAHLNSDWPYDCCHGVVKAKLL